MPASGRPPLRAWIGALESVAAMQRDPRLTLAGMIATLAGTHADRPALIEAGAVLDYAALARRVAAVAAWAAARPPGTVVGLLMQASADYVAIWLGIGRGGCVAALLNHQLSGDALAQAIAAGSCAMVIASPDLASRLSGVPVLAPDALAARAASCPPPPDPAATALLVFTSGTTGMPKAARLTHARITEWALWFAGMMDVQPEDRIYDCLPLHHSTGGIVAIGAALVRGASVRIAPAFSASRFWAEVIESGSTIVFYIGELCRYLLGAPPPAAHAVRLACGNGLRQAVWEAFQSRCSIPAILEFYAATEGSISLYNCEGRPGAIGRIPPFLRARFPLALVRIDAATGNPLRGADGLCIACADGEAGEALGRIDATPSGPARHFDGYTDAAASASKLVADVLAPGDRWFRSGDLMRRDAAGFLYFVDRMGETFRWKGENVSTEQVAACLRAAQGVADAVVYGVEVPGHEGRAGMAAIVAAPGFAPATLHAHIAAALPSYARPLFLRLCPGLDLTGTFKLVTTRLAREGFGAHGDPLLFDDRQAAAYVPLDPVLRAEIEAGTRRL